MMDAPGQYFLQAAGENEIAGALWLVDEGDYLNNSVRRYGQVFVARGVIWWPSRWRRTVAIHWQRTLRGRRVSRIAVHPARQREGTGQQLIAGALQYTRDLDYLSVSFGYTGSYGVSGTAAVLCWCGWVIIVKPAAVAIRRWRCYR
ncbi:putative ATP-dependent acetyltransferase [Escherichia coli]|uniref:Putative ATP-dependent acetyltransferase n=1 Tax=Escherichia coli TaxID=562 RepID=A0A377C7Q3_ECOLX|nr:putative ATP-dependent acetyltransferase [Escherichia coli]